MTFKAEEVITASQARARSSRGDMNAYILQTVMLQIMEQVALAADQGYYSTVVKHISMSATAELIKHLKGMKYQVQLYPSSIPGTCDIELNWNPK